MRKLFRTDTIKNRVPTLMKQTKRSGSRQRNNTIFHDIQILIKSTHDGILRQKSTLFNLDKNFAMMGTKISCSTICFQAAPRSKSIDLFNQYYFDITKSLVLSTYESQSNPTSLQFVYSSSQRGMIQLAQLPYLLIYLLYESLIMHKIPPNIYFRLSV